MSNTKFDPSNVKLDSPFSVFAVFDPVIIRLSALLLIVTVVPTLLESTQFNCDPVDVKTCPEFPSSPSLSCKPPVILTPSVVVANLMFLL